MDSVALVFGIVSLYLYLEIWTIRVAARYGGWVVAWVLAIDHALLLSFGGVPVVLFWKVWFFWTSLRAEALRGHVWKPDLRLDRFKSVTFAGRGLAKRLVLAAAVLLALLLGLGWAASAEVESVAVLAAVVLVLPLVILSMRLLLLKARGWLGPQKRFREPLPWDRGPATW